MKISLIQDRFQVGDIRANADRIIELAQQASARGAELVVFPELALSGYPPEDLIQRAGFMRQCEQQCLRIQNALASSVGDTGVIFGLPMIHDSGQNSDQRLQDNDEHAGDDTGFATRKGDDGLHHRVYNAAVYIYRGVVRAYYFKQSLPNYSVFDEQRYFMAGSQQCVIEHGGHRFGLLICEDVWRSDIVEDCVAAGVNAVIVINASPFHQHKHAERIKMLRANVIHNKVPFLYLNMVGGQDELVFDGDSLVMDTNASLVCRGKLFEEVAIDLLLDDTQVQCAGTMDVDIEEYPVIEAVTYKALVTGVRDFVHQNGFKGVVIGLSGGVDSALTLAVAVDALGADNVMAVMMPSRYTADISLADAEAEAKLLGVEYEVLEIEDLFGQFMQTLSPVFKDAAADTTEENLQARCRGVLLMAISNKQGRMLLTTGNKSEMAVGYATLYGDMCGGFAPIKDVCKTLVYKLCHYRNSLSAVIPERVLTRAPSAELRADQTDQDSLPDYAVLDRILKLSVEQDMPVDEIVANGIDRSVVEQVIILVQRNEHKRRQSAPGIRVTRRAFGRDRRYPITSGYRRK